MDSFSRSLSEPACVSWKPLTRKCAERVKTEMA